MEQFRMTFSKNTGMLYEVNKNTAKKCVKVTLVAIPLVSLQAVRFQLA